MSNIGSGTSLLDRMGVAPSARTARVGRLDRHSPYDRASRPSSNDPWKHDMFAKQNKIEGGELGARMAVPDKAPASSSASRTLSLQKPLSAAGAVSHPKNSKDFSIRGASGVTVEVRELVKGTTAADVEAIFNRCGNVISSKLTSTSGADSETVHIKFETQDHAAEAVSMFNKQAADGRILEVEILGNALMPTSKSVDALLEDGNTGGSKLRSDAIMATDSRAQVLTNPLGKPSARGGPRRRRGRGGKTAAGRMEVD